MAIQDRRQISLGLGNLEFGTYNANTNVFQGYTDIGAIKSEVTIDTQREVLDFESGRPLITIIQEVVREKVMVKATLAEVNMATIKMALGQGNIYSNTVPTFLDGSSSALLGTLQPGYTLVGSG